MDISRRVTNVNKLRAKKLLSYESQETEDINKQTPFCSRSIYVYKFVNALHKARFC